MPSNRINQPPSSKHGEYKKPRKRTVSGAILTFAVVVIAIVFLMSVFLRISDISVEGNEHYSDEEIIKAIDIEQGDNLFFFDRFAAISRVFAKLPYVEEVSLERQLPNKVIITVQECKALAYIAVGDENWTIDRSCKVLGKATEDELGTLIRVEGLDPGTLLIGERLTSADGHTLLDRHRRQERRGPQVRHDRVGPGTAQRGRRRDHQRLRRNGRAFRSAVSKTIYKKITITFTRMKKQLDLVREM